MVGGEGNDSSQLLLLQKSLDADDQPQAPNPLEQVLASAKYIKDNAIDVAISPSNTKTAASHIYALMQERQYSTHSWSLHELHPKPDGGEATLNFIFVLDLLNFSFWSEKSEKDQFAVQYGGKHWTGYWSLVAGLKRAIEEGASLFFPLSMSSNLLQCLVLTARYKLFTGFAWERAGSSPYHGNDIGFPVTDPRFWRNQEALTLERLKHIFRSSTLDEMPMMRERLDCLREAGSVLCDKYDGAFANCLHAAKRSATSLVSILIRDFPCLRDEHDFDGRRVHIYKRAQIMVADIWACFNGREYGEFDDVGSITMFADYRIPQMLNSLGVLLYSPHLEGRIRRKEQLRSGETCEIEIRGCSIWAVELLKQVIHQQQQQYPESSQKINSILIDTFLYDMIKDMERRGVTGQMLPHHRTRSIWY